MSVIDEGHYLGVAETLEETEEYNKFLVASRELEEIELAEETLKQTSEMDKDTVAGLESKYPGIVTDNIRFDDRYTSVGHQACVESLKRKKQVLASDIATSFLGMVKNLNTMAGKLKNTHVAGGVTGTLNAISKQVKSVQMAPDKLTDEKLIIAYTDMMGIEPDNANQVRELIKKLPSYKNPVMCLKDFPNTRFDKMFTPLLANAVSDNTKIFDAFEAMNDHYAEAIVNNIYVVQNEIGRIVREEDHGALARFTKDVIPRDVDIVLNDIVAALDIKISPSKPLLSQVRTIGSGVSKKLRVTEDSLNKKGSIVNAVTHRYGHIDAGFDALNQCTNKLAKLDDGDINAINEIQSGLKEMRQHRSKAVIINQTITTQGRQSSQQYKRIMGGIRDLWQLVNLFTRLSVAYVSCYSILKITLDKFSLRMLAFLKATGDLKQK